MSDPFVTQILCFTGLFLAVIIGAMPILKGILKRRKGTPPEDHLEERNEAAAMLIASYRYSKRVKYIYNLLDKITTLEKMVPHAKEIETTDS